MNGWAFAAVALGVILAFEYVLFRYFTPDRPTSRFDGAGEPSDASGGAGTSERRSLSPARGAAADGDAVECHHCGTHNVDVSTIVFCRDCLGRLP